MFRLPLVGIFTVSVAIIITAGPVAGQNLLPEPWTAMTPFIADSGERGNPAAAAGVVYQQPIHVPGARSIRLHFAEATLAPGSFILVTGQQDGQQQRQGPAELALWGNSSAYFNGDTVHLELHAAGGSAHNRVRIEQVEMGVVPGGAAPGLGEPGLCGICNEDEREPSTELWVGRLLPIGCTASIICENNTALTAGHCASGAQVLQFNVPPSNPDCSIAHPPVDEQYPVVAESLTSVWGGLGNDWAVFRAGASSSGQTPYETYGQLRRPLFELPAIGAGVRVLGYGADADCGRNHVQQESVGEVVSTWTSFYQFDADIRGGSSGSPVLVNGMVAGVVTHCSTEQCGNIAQRLDLPALRSAIQNTMTCNHALHISAMSGGESALGAWITITPGDLNGRSSGLTPMERFFDAGASVSLRAPRLVGPDCFVHWLLLDDKNVLVLHELVEVSAPRRAVAHYVDDPCCRADWNRDSAVSSSDLSEFLSQWLEDLAAGTQQADFNGDGVVNSADIAAFVSNWLSAQALGC